MVSAIILAAGLSQRMGTNKMLLPIGDKSILQHTVENVLASKVSERLIVSGHESQKIQQLLSAYSLRWIHNTNYKKGMTSSIQCGVAQAIGNGYLILPGDMPFISTDSLNQLIDLFEAKLQQNPACIVSFSYANKWRNPIIFSQEYRAQILEHQVPNGCKEIAKRHLRHLSTIPISNEDFFKDFDVATDLLL